MKNRSLAFGYLFSGILLTLSHPLSADEGQVLTGAWNLYNNAEVYRDFFEFIGPGSFAWVHLFFELLGPDYQAALVASWVLLCLGLLAFAACMRLLTDSAVAVGVASAFWLLIATEPPFINHNTYSSYLAVAFAYVMVAAPRWKLHLLAGAIAGLTFFFLQPKGLALLCVGSIFVLFERDRTASAFFAGAAGALALGFATWGLGPVTSVVLVGSGNVGMNHATVSYSALLAALTLLAAVAAACHEAGLLDRRVRFLLALQVGLWLSTLHLPDLWHLSINAFPLLMVLALLASRRLARFPLKIRRATVLALALIAIIWGIRATNRNIRMTGVTERWLTELRGQIGNAEFFQFTFLPSFYLELGVENPYYNSVLYERSHPPEHFERNVELLRIHRPRKVLADYSTVKRYGHTGENPVDRYIRRHYARTASIQHGEGQLEIWTRRPD